MKLIKRFIPYYRPFIGVFVLDQSYDWKTDTYPTEKPMIPRLKYNRILDMIDTESFRK